MVMRRPRALGFIYVTVCVGCWEGVALVWRVSALAGLELLLGFEFAVLPSFLHAGGSIRACSSGRLSDWEKEFTVKN